MSKEENIKNCWSICLECQGTGYIKQRSRKFVRLRYQKALAEFEKNKENTEAPLPPKSSYQLCENCDSSGLIPSSHFPLADANKFPTLAIIGGGIGGMALAVACFQRGIPFTLFERDHSFDSRSQGYGLTLQQASRAMKSFGVLSLPEGLCSTNHVVHNTDGAVLFEWGVRHRLDATKQKNPKRTNIHIARQSLRASLFEQIGRKELVQWSHQLISYQEQAKGGLELIFHVNGAEKKMHADLLVGADGIRSVVRSILIGEDASPLHYLGCIVILGICPLAEIKGIESHLLDGATVFQTVNGTERIYVMPYSKDTVMWQLSFPMSEKEAKNLSAQGPQALKNEACRITQWHSPVPQMVAATPIEYISGYPVYDRPLLSAESLAKSECVSLIGDAAHPMSPFKGQGANQALLDALVLSRQIMSACNFKPEWRNIGLRKAILNDFESEMLGRSSSKVSDSAEAVELLHSKVVLREGDGAKRRSLKG